MDLGAEDIRGAAIGRVPAARTCIHVLDQAGQPVPPLVVGELYVGGSGIARGYLEEPDLTAQKFVADPFSDTPGRRLHRTGDIGRRRNDGAIELLAAGDAELTVHGVPVDLVEIELTLLEHPRVRDAAVVRHGTGSATQLVAYYVPDGVVTVDALHGYLSSAVPEHMVPAAYVQLPRLPLAPDGTLARDALPVPDAGAYLASADAPLTATEAVVARIWSEVLRVPEVGRRDDFFELGGHSLLAVQVVSRVRQLLGARVELSEVFASPRLLNFARAIESAHERGARNGGAELEATAADMLDATATGKEQAL